MRNVVDTGVTTEKIISRPDLTGHLSVQRVVHIPHVRDTSDVGSIPPTFVTRQLKTTSGSGRVLQRGVHIPHVRDTPDVGSISPTFVTRQLMTT